MLLAINPLGKLWFYLLITSEHFVPVFPVAGVVRRYQQTIYIFDSHYGGSIHAAGSTPLALNFSDFGQTFSVIPFSLVVNIKHTSKSFLLLRGTEIEKTIEAQLCLSAINYLVTVKHM